MGPREQMLDETADVGPGTNLSICSRTMLSTLGDFGNIQLFDSKNRVLRIVAHYGFEGEFLDYFDTVSVKDDCACSRAMNGRSRVVVTDVASDTLSSAKTPSSRNSFYVTCYLASPYLLDFKAGPSFGE